MQLLLYKGFETILVHSQAASPTFILTGNIVGGLPEFNLPPFGINRTSTVDDPTIGEIFSEAGSVLATLPMICILCHIAIAKAFGEFEVIQKLGIKI